MKTKECNSQVHTDYSFKAVIMQMKDGAEEGCLGRKCLLQR